MAEPFNYLSRAKRAQITGKPRQSLVDAARPGLTEQRMRTLQSDAHTDTYTLFTQIGGNRLLYSAEEWVVIRLRLETAGPVAVSTREQVAPVLGGQGILLSPEEVEFTLPKGDRLFYTAAAVNRVRVIIEPVPWLERILRTVELGFEQTISGLDPLGLLPAFIKRIIQGGPR